MAAPHAAGVAALIVSQYGEAGRDGDVKLPPQKVESLLLSTAVDIGEPGYDTCFGHGRIDALRAVTGDASSVRRERPALPRVRRVAASTPARAPQLCARAGVPSR